MEEVCREVYPSIQRGGSPLKFIAIFPPGGFTHQVPGGVLLEKKMQAALQHLSHTGQTSPFCSFPAIFASCVAEVTNQGDCIGEQRVMMAPSCSERFCQRPPNNSPKSIGPPGPSKTSDPAEGRPTAQRVCQVCCSRRRTSRRTGC